LAKSVADYEIAKAQQATLPEQKTKAYDTENIPGLPSKVGGGEEPIPTESKQGAGTQETSTGGVLQAPGAEGKGKAGSNEKIKSKSQLPEQIKKLKEEEQSELDSKIDNAEQYRVDGKVDRDKLTNKEDIKAFDEVYDKYDKLITPLLKEGVGEDVKQINKTDFDENGDLTDDGFSKATNILSGIINDVANKYNIPKDKLLQHYNIKNGEYRSSLKGILAMGESQDYQKTIKLVKDIAFEMFPDKIDELNNQINSHSDELLNSLENGKPFEVNKSIGKVVSALFEIDENWNKSKAVAEKKVELPKQKTKENENIQNKEDKRKAEVVKPEPATTKAVDKERLEQSARNVGKREEAKTNLLKLRDEGVLVTADKSVIAKAKKAMGMKVKPVPMTDAEINAQMSMLDAMSNVWKETTGQDNFYDTFISDIKKGDLKAIKDKGGVLFQDESVPTRPISRVTLSVFDAPQFEKMKGQMVVPQSISDFIKGKGKQIEKDIINNVLAFDKYKGQKRISFDDFRNDVEIQVMKL
jgi:hypothetical protein